MFSFPEFFAELQLGHPQTTYKCSEKDISSVNGFGQQFGVNCSMLHKNDVLSRVLSCIVLFRVSRNTFNPPAEKQAQWTTRECEHDSDVCLENNLSCRQVAATTDYHIHQIRRFRFQTVLMMTQCSWVVALGEGNNQ